MWSLIILQPCTYFHSLTSYFFTVLVAFFEPSLTNPQLIIFTFVTDLYFDLIILFFDLLLTYLDSLYLHIGTPYSSYSSAPFPLVTFSIFYFNSKIINFHILSLWAVNWNFIECFLTIVTSVGLCFSFLCISLHLFECFLSIIKILITALIA